MRTTLTLDDDVAILIARLRKERDLSLKEAVNRSLRAGLRSLDEEPRSTPPFRTETVSLGRCLIGDLTDVSEALSIAEGDDHR